MAKSRRATISAPTGEAIADTWNATGSAREALINATSRWGVLTLAALLDGPLRFAALRRAIGGISDRMLSQTLQLFEIDGLVEREVLSQIPPHVEYRLTPSGEPIATKMAELIAAIHDQLPAILESRSRH